MNYRGHSWVPLKLLAWGVGIAALPVALHLLFPPDWVRPAQAQPTVGLPFGTQTTMTGTAAQVIGYNPSRRSIQICNGTGAVASCTPTPITPTAANGVQVATSTCFAPPAYLLSSGSAGGAGAAWNCIGASGVITVLEW